MALSAVAWAGAMRINGLLILIATIVLLLGVVCSDQLLGTKLIESLMSAVTWHKKDKQKASVPEVIPSATNVTTATSARQADGAGGASPSAGTTASGDAPAHTATAPNDANVATIDDANTSATAASTTANASDVSAGQKHKLSPADQADLDKANFIANGAAVLCKNKQYPEAIVETAKALEASERCAYAYHIRASCYSRLGLLKTAALDYKHSIWAMPERFAWDLNGLTEVYIKLDQAQKAVGIDSDFISHYPKNEWGYNARSMAYRSLGEDDKAIADATTALAINPKQFEAHSVRLAVLTKRKQYADAIRDVSTTINYYPTIDWLYLRRAELYEKTGDQEKARADRLTAQRYKAPH